MNDRKPFYKFPTSDARNPQPTDATLLFDEPLEKEGKWGPYWIYKMRINGEEESIPATKGLHNAIQNAMGRKGDTLSVIRMGEGKDTRWDVINTNDAALYGENPPEKAPAARQAPPPVQQASNTKERFYDNMERYKRAWNLASEFLETQQQTGDINAIAFTFYKMASDAGYDLLDDTSNDFPDEAPF